MDYIQSVREGTFRPKDADVMIDRHPWTVRKYWKLAMELCLLFLNLRLRLTVSILRPVRNFHLKIIGRSEACTCNVSMFDRVLFVSLKPAPTHHLGRCTTLTSIGKLRQRITIATRIIGHFMPTTSFVHLYNAQGIAVAWVGTTRFERVLPDEIVTIGKHNFVWVLPGWRTRFPKTDQPPDGLVEAWSMMSASAKKREAEAYAVRTPLIFDALNKRRIPRICADPADLAAATKTIDNHCTLC